MSDSSTVGVCVSLLAIAAAVIVSEWGVDAMPDRADEMRRRRTENRPCERCPEKRSTFDRDYKEYLCDRCWEKLPVPSRQRGNDRAGT